jgi:hypothetical protein
MVGSNRYLGGEIAAVDKVMISSRKFLHSCSNVSCSGVVEESVGGIIFTGWVSQYNVLGGFSMRLLTMVGVADGGGVR